MLVYGGDPARLAMPDPVLSPKLLSFVAAAYALRVDRAVKLGGSFNLNVLLDGHVLRVYGPWVSAPRLAAIQGLRRALRGRGLPVPAPRPSTDGAPYERFGECVLEVERYVPGEPMDSRARLRAGMGHLARLHALMADLPLDVPPPIANHLPQDLAEAATADAMDRLRAWGPTPQEEHLARAAEALARALPRIELPSQPVHGDFWHNNVRWRGDRMVAVLDFDFAGIRPRIDDLALPLTYALGELGPERRIEDVRELLEAYAAACSPPLARDERRALPHAMARMALSFLQYLTIPCDDERKAGLRQEFADRRGPACLWWWRAIRGGMVREDSFL